MSEILIKPCPCCGDSAEIVHPYYPAKDAVVECQTCYLRTSDEATDQEAIDTWNRRDPLVVALARVARLEAALVNWDSARHNCPPGIYVVDPNNLCPACEAQSKLHELAAALRRARREGE